MVDSSLSANNFRQILAIFIGPHGAAASSRVGVVNRVAIGLRKASLKHITHTFMGGLVRLLLDSKVCHPTRRYSATIESWHW
jgi:hypothetical protein